MDGGRRSRGIAAAALAAGLVAVLAAGCSGSGAPTSESGAAPDRGVPAPAEVQKDAAEAAPARVPADAPERRSIVYKGTLTVRSKDVPDAATRAGSLTTAARGFVAGDTREGTDGRETATLILRVPSDRFYDTVTRVAALGDEVDRAIGTEDVTEAVIDLDTRIASQRASVARTRVLLARAERIADIVTIEKELSSREAELAGLEARQRVFADQVTFSTITLRLVSPAVVITEKEPERGFLAGLSAGWSAFTATATALLTVAGAMLPFLVALAIPLVVLWLALRRAARRRRDRAPRPPVDAAGATA